MRAVSFNVLADAYISYGDYSHVRPELLEPGARTDAIIRLLRKLNADVAGLQEVDETLFTRLHDADEWQSFLTPKGKSKPDGCMMLVKHDIAVEDFRSYEYSDRSGHIAQCIKIGGTVLANTHIKWAPADSADHIGVRQTEELLDIIGPGSAVLFADCNDQLGGPVRQVIEAAGFVNLPGDIPTALVNQEPIALDLLAIRDVTGRDLTQSYDLHQIPSKTCPSDHIPLTAEIDL